MENELNIFENEEFGKVRVTNINGEIYFMLVDVCRVLEINNPRQTKTRLNKDGVISNDVIDSLGRTQKADFINESNLYKLTFQSRKPQAERFSDWVTSEVLPSIRKNGGYIANQESMTSEQVLANAVLVAQRVIDNQNKQLAEMKPHAILGRAITTANTSILVGDMAKILYQNGIKNMGSKRFFQWLRDNGYLIKRKGSDWNMPTQRSVENGLFEIKESVHIDGNGCNIITKTPKITGQGQQYFVNKFLQSQNAVSAI